MDHFPEAEAAGKAKDKLLEVQRAECSDAFKRGRIEDGLEAYAEFVEANPGSNWKPVPVEEIDRYRQLVARYKPAAAKEKQQVTMALALYLGGLELATEGQADQALEKHELLIKDYGVSPWAKKAKLGMPKLMYECACYWVGKGDPKQAANILKDLVRRFPGDDYAKQAQSDLRHVLNVPKGMVYVPPGDLIMGSTEEQIKSALAGQDTYKKADFEDEIPRHVVKVNAFYIDMREVACEEYRKFIESTKREPPLNWLRGRPMAGKEKHPVIMVSYEDAEAYATWVNKRLPTEAEWELAARGTDGRVFPWGNEYQEGTGNIMSGKRLFTRPVGSYPAGASPCGCLDMIGNAAEWVAGWYAPYPGAKFRSKKFGETHRMVRGGSWQTPAPAGARCARRMAVTAKSDDYYTDYITIGFRCAKTPE